MIEGEIKCVRSERMGVGREKKNEVDENLSCLKCWYIGCNKG